MTQNVNYLLKKFYEIYLYLNSLRFTDNHNDNDG